MIILLDRLDLFDESKGPGNLANHVRYPSFESARLVIYRESDDSGMEYVVKDRTWPDRQGIWYSRNSY